MTNETFAFVALVSVRRPTEACWQAGDRSVCLKAEESRIHTSFCKQHKISATLHSTDPSVQRMIFELAALNILSNSLYMDSRSTLFTDSSDFNLIIKSEILSRTCGWEGSRNNVTDGPSYLFMPLKAAQPTHHGCGRELESLTFPLLL